MTSGHCILKENISYGYIRSVHHCFGLDRQIQSFWTFFSVIDVNEVVRTTVNLLKEIYAKQGISVHVEIGKACNVKGHFSEFNLLTSVIARCVMDLLY